MDKQIKVLSGSTNYYISSLTQGKEILACIEHVSGVTALY